MDFAARYGPWALVTGASSGLGEAYARALAARGLHLLISARRGERLRTLAAELRAAHGIEVRTVTGDLLEPATQRELQAAADTVDLGLFVCNAGRGTAGRLVDVPERELVDLLRLNCEAPLRLLRALGPALCARGRGGVIVVASVASFVCTPWSAAYGASKAFALHLAEALTVEWGEAGVDVLAVCPGHTATEFHQTAGVERAALGRAADPNEVVDGSLRQLGRRMTWVHGGRNRWSVRVLGLAPRMLAAWASGRLLRDRADARRGGWSP